MERKKSDIRAMIRRGRAARPRPVSPSEALDLLTSWLGALDALGRPDPVLPALFVPTRREPDVSLIVDSCSRCLLPVLVDAEGSPLDEVAWALSARGKGLAQPSDRHPAQPAGPLLAPSALADADAILVAALGVDESGMRLGQGGGWYDRALVHRAPDTPIIAAVFADEVLSDDLPAQAHDIPVDAAITESGFRVLRQARPQVRGS